MPKPPVKTGVLSGKTGGVAHKWWLLGGIGAGGVAFLYYRKSLTKPSTTDPTSAVDPNAPDTSGYSDPYTGYDSGYGTAVGGTYGGSAATDPTFAQAAAEEAAAAVDSATALGNIADELGNPPSGASPETNTQWMHHAIQYLEEHGYTKAAARAAVTAYLAGAPLTQKQAHTVESAIGKVGTPPDGAPRVHIEHVPKQPKGDRTPPHKTHKKTAAKHH